MRTLLPFNLSASFTRPANTTAYTSGDLVANSVTAGSVTALTFATKLAAGTYIVRRAKLAKSGTGVTNAAFRVHLYRTAAITCGNGDNGAYSTDGVLSWLGSLDVTVDQVFSDGAAQFGFPNKGSECGIRLSEGDTLAALIEARGAYTPGSAEVFTLTLDLFQY